MSLPWFKFFPSDWLNDINIRRATNEDVGFLIKIMCLMHQCEPYGYLSKEFELKLPKPLSEDSRTSARLLGNLERLCLLRRDSKNMLLYNKRMVKDEEIRVKKARAGKQGGQVSAQANAQAKLQAASDSASASGIYIENIKKDIVSNSSVFEFFEKNGFGMLSSFLAQELQLMTEEHKEENVLKAMQIATTAGRKDLRYVKGILKIEKQNEYRWEKPKKEYKKLII